MHTTYRYVDALFEIALNGITVKAYNYVFHKNE